jgi:hypothetical protein
VTLGMGESSWWASMGVPEKRVAIHEPTTLVLRYSKKETIYVLKCTMEVGYR